MNDPRDMSEVMAEGRDMLFSLATTAKRPVMAATMGWAAALLQVAAMASRDEVGSNPAAMETLREVLLVPQGVDDADVAAAVVTEIVSQRGAISTYATRVESALTQHTDDLGLCRTCGRPYPCETRRSLED